MTRSEELAAGLEAVRSRLEQACRAAGRAPSDVRLVAVSKTWPATDVSLLQDLGVTDFGENRDQEAAQKAGALADRSPVWHFVGAVQSNKARSIASYADVVHSLDRDSLVGALDRGALAAGRTLDVLLQVSLDGDPSRGGASASALGSLADTVERAGALRLCGLMAVAPLGVEPLRAFAQLADIATRLRADHPTAIELSAGMSADLEPAVTHGSTLVRVGTAVFGHRPPLLR